MDEQDDNKNNDSSIKGSVDIEAKTELDPEAIRDIFAEALKENKVEGKLPGMILEMLDSTMNSSKKKASPSEDNVIELQPKPAPQPTGPRESSPFEKEVQANIRKAVSDYISGSLDDEKVQESKELNIDADFLKEHGASLAGSVLGAFAKSIIPEDFKLDVTPEGDKKEDGSGDDQVSVKLDIGGMLQTLFDSTQKGKQEQPADEDE